MRYTTQEKELLTAVRANLVKGVIEAGIYEGTPEIDKLHDIFEEALDDLNTVFPRERGDGYLGGFNP